jgi:hypothetical protein
VLPASASGTFQRAIRTGKLENGNLVDGNASDDDADDENVQEILDLIRKGEVRNMGPIADLSSDGPPSSNQSESPVPAVTAPKARSDVQRPSSSATRNDNAQSPKIPPGNTSPAGADVRPPLADGEIDLKSGSKPVPSPALTNPRSESFSGPPLTSLPTTTFSSPSPAPQQNVIISPSFPPPSSRPLRPPVVMSTAVRERGMGTVETAQVRPEKPERKVSRFMANRA